MTISSDRSCSREHEFEGEFGVCKGCGLYVEECIDLRYCPGEKVQRTRKTDEEFES